MKASLALAVLLLVSLAAAGQGISEKGVALSKAYDSLDVESHWLKGKRIDWRTGDPLPGDKRGGTHCSAFVAAACEKLGVYILRPSEHPQALLANAQHDWLLERGAESGWSKVESMESAQRLANNGEIVAASFKEPSGKPGHIALVRPSEKPPEAIAAEGPDIIQAGGKNCSRTSLKEGFKLHRGAFPGGIAFFSHPCEIKPEREEAAASGLKASRD